MKGTAESQCSFVRHGKDDLPRLYGPAVRSCCSGIPSSFEVFSLPIEEMILLLLERCWRVRGGDLLVLTVGSLAVGPLHRVLQQGINRIEAQFVFGSTAVCFNRLAAQAQPSGDLLDAVSLP